MAEEISGRRKKIPPTIIDIGVAIAVVACILIAMFIYTGMWPPLVVIESKSMQHSSDESSIGTIDTGDLVLVKRVNDQQDITTYLQDILSNERKYGDYGDVIIYKRGGLEQYTPIIHRAVMYIEPNSDDESYRVEALRYFVRGTDYDLVNSDDTWDGITGTIILYNYGYSNMVLDIPLGGIIANSVNNNLSLRDGFITKGDFNSDVDQYMGAMHSREPVSIDWVVGKARGEIPWFGIMKLWVTGTLPDDTPSNSIRNLWITLGIIISIPFITETIFWWRSHRLPDEEIPHIIANEESASPSPSDEKTPEVSDQEGESLSSESDDSGKTEENGAT